MQPLWRYRPRAGADDEREFRQRYVGVVAHVVAGGRGPCHVPFD